MKQEVIPDHPVAADWVFIKLRPVVDKLVAIVIGEVAKGQVTIPCDHVAMLAVGICIRKTPIMRFELTGVQFRGGWLVGPMVDAETKGRVVWIMRAGEDGGKLSFCSFYHGGELQQKRTKRPT
jgi:hypothetical protein